MPGARKKKAESPKDGEIAPAEENVEEFGDELSEDDWKELEDEWPENDDDWDEEEWEEDWEEEDEWDDEGEW